jgi:hypothetical protein
MPAFGTMAAEEWVMEAVMVAARTVGSYTSEDVWWTVFGPAIERICISCHQ